MYTKIVLTVIAVLLGMTVFRPMMSPTPTEATQHPKAATLDDVVRLLRKIEIHLAALADFAFIRSTAPAPIPPLLPEPCGLLRSKPCYVITAQDDYMGLTHSLSLIPATPKPLPVMVRSTPLSVRVENLPIPIGPTLSEPVFGTRVSISNWPKAWKCRQEPFLPGESRCEWTSY